jgi:hypothetical protein
MTARLLYSAAHEFASLLPATSGNAETQRMCLLLSAAATLEAAGSSPDKASQLASEVLELLERARPFQPQAAIADKSAPLLTLMAFRARALLGEHKTIAELAEQAARNIPGMTGSVFEAMADSSGVQADLKAELLRRSLSAILAAPGQTQQQQAEKASRVVRKLITSADRDSSFQHFETALKLASQQGQLHGAWPEQELDWLVASAWNSGVFFSRILAYTKAERWMSLAMSLAKVRRPGSRPILDDEAARAYTAVLEKVRSSC